MGSTVIGICVTDTCYDTDLAVKVSVWGGFIVQVIASLSLLNN